MENYNNKKVKLRFENITKFDGVSSIPRHLCIRGTSHWQKWKQRYIVLVQVGPVIFCLCSYREKQATPSEMLTLEGYTVNYYTPDPNGFQEFEEDSKFQVRLALVCFFSWL